MPQILLRIRTKDGMKRIQIDKSSSLKDLYQKVYESLYLNNNENEKKNLFLTSEHGQPIPINSEIIIPFNHGDIVNIRYESLSNSESSFSSISHSSIPINENSSSSLDFSHMIDPLDSYMKNQTGLVRAERCNLHPSGQQCSSCLDLEPYDKDYLKSKGIKHLSFYSYLKSLNGSLVSPPSIVTSSSSSTCTKHPSGGRCSSCQPSSITLNLQSWRMVDHVEIENPRIIDEFLSSGWRKDGYQRFAWLLGYYSSYEGVPLGIKAVITAISIPGQDSSIDGVQLLDPESSPPDLYSKCKIVGMIYTDLTNDSGKVLYHRNKDSYFISSTECYFMAKQQIKHPTILPSPSSRSQSLSSNCNEKFQFMNWSSRFVTLVLTGDEHGNIEIMAYQVSMMAESLSRMNLLKPSNEPSLMCIKEEENVDLYYRDTNEYGYEIKKRADPTFPVEYLLVALTHGFPTQQSIPTLFLHPEILEGNIRSASLYLHKFIHQELLDQLSNYSLLSFISGTFLTSSESIWLTKSILERNEKELENFIMSSPGWHTFQELLQSQADIDSNGNHLLNNHDNNNNYLDNDIEELGWSCPHCTFYNAGRMERGNGERNCEMCLLPPS